MKKILINILILTLFLLTNINAGQQEIKQPSNNLVTVSSDSPAPNWVVEKADNYLISLLGQNYFEDKFILRKSSSHNPIQKGDYTSNYHVSYDYNIKNQNLYASVRLDSDGDVVYYEGPEKLYSLNINKEDAIEIAKRKGLKEPIEAKLVYGIRGFISDTGTIEESIMWDVWGEYYEKNDLEVVYIDIDSGEILGVKTYPNLDISMDLYSNKKVNKIITHKKDNKLQGPIKQKQSWFSKIIQFLKSLFKSKDKEIKNKKKVDPKDCEQNSDCEAVFLTCGCQWGCFNKNSDAGLIQCMMDCGKKSLKPNCECINNNCKLKD